MINILLIIVLSLSGLSNAMASSWSFVKVKDEYFMQSPNGLNHKVVVETGIPQVSKIEDLNPHISKIEYLAGEAGTSQNVQIYRAALFYKKTNKFIGDYPYQYKGDAKFIQPQWKIVNNELFIKDENEGLDIKVKLDLAL